MYDNPEGLDNHPELIQIQFRPKLCFYIGCTDSIDKGHTVPDIEDRETMKTKVSQARNRIMVGLCGCKLSNTLSPVFLSCFSGEVSTSSKDGKGLMK